jgi:hypothetical protein
MNLALHRCLVRYRALLLAVAVTFIATRADAQDPVATGTLTDPITGLSTVTITGNQSFQLSLRITTNFVTTGLTYFLRSDNGSGLFQVVARHLDGSPFTNLAAADEDAFGGNAGLLDPVNNHDLGGVSPCCQEFGPGTFMIATFTFNTLNAPLGQYTIFIDGGLVTDATGSTFVDRPFTAVATINVVPEPASASLLLLGSPAILGALGWRHFARRLARFSKLSLLNSPV